MSSLRLGVWLLLAGVPSVFGSTIFLAVDFQNSISGVNQTGFSQFAGAASQPGISSNTYSTVNGNVTVSLNLPTAGGAGYFHRTPTISDSGALTYADLYNDFAYSNSPCGGCANQTDTLTVTLSGPGVSASTTYDLTFYSWDNRAASGSHTVTISGMSGTTGPNGVILSDFATPPTTNNQYSTTQLYVSDSSGTLTFLVSDFYGFISDTRSGVRLNAVVLSSAPEPGSLALLGVGLGVLALRTRQRRG
jgi:hypothetical protein